MNKRSTLGGGTLLALTLLFIGLTILFNYALRGWRLDLTQNRLYTIAPGTDRILASVKEPITCTSSSRRRPQDSCRSSRPTARGCAISSRS